MSQRKVAILFGGVSPEHDVSILTGVQAFYALDQTRYEAIPVYIDQNGRWWFGHALIENHNEIVNGCRFSGVKEVSLGQGGLYAGGKRIMIVDVCLIALHGGDGEDGTIQGLCEMNQMPYTGMRRTGATIAMNKWLTKKTLSAQGVDVLPDHLFRKSPNNAHYTIDQLKSFKINYPVCVKPCSLGSSVGVGFADDVETLHALMLDLFDHDEAVLVEPAVQSLKEFNVSVLKNDKGLIELSAIESPKTEAWLDFNQKYCQGGGSKKQSAHGLINLSRDFSPKMPKAMQDAIIDSAKIAFKSLGGFGAPRIDFIADMSQERIWFNEINANPGSFGYYLWAAKNQCHGYVWLLNHLLDEAIEAFLMDVQKSPVPKSARLFKRNSA
ncbi:MAG: hypothetical protein P8L77_04250 [Gammaproteobacteria bacterium]|nr:hypothetical protein [Gammaproteobacteria bacterium]